MIRWISFTNGNAFSFIGSLSALKEVLKTHKWTHAHSFKCIEL